MFIDVIAEGDKLAFEQANSIITPRHSRKQMGLLFNRLVIGLLMFFARHWTKFWMNRALNQVRDIGLQMNHVMCSLCAVRIILIKAENGGGIVDRDTPLYLTALNWVYAKQDKQFYKDRMFRHRADKLYWEHVVQKILANEFIIVETDTLPDLSLIHI